MIVPILTRPVGRMLPLQRLLDHAERLVPILTRPVGRMLLPGSGILAALFGSNPHPARRPDAAYG